MRRIGVHIGADVKKLAESFSSPRPKRGASRRDFIGYGFSAPRAVGLLDVCPSLGRGEVRVSVLMELRGVSGNRQGGLYSTL